MTLNVSLSMTPNQYITAKYLKAIQADYEKGGYPFHHTYDCIRHGILINPFIAINESTAKHLITLYGVDLQNANSTFYKTFKEREERTIDQVMIERIIHYLTSYNDAFFTPFVPNEGEAEFMEAIRSQLTTIEVLTKEEMTSQVQKLVDSGMALASEDIREITNLVNDLGVKPNGTNKELQIEMACRFGLIPTTPELLVRSISRILLDTTEAVKNKAYYEKLEMICTPARSFNNLFEDKTQKVCDLVKAYIEANGIQSLADHFRPNKKFWLIIKKLGLQKEVNAMKRLSEKSRVDHSFKTILDEFPEDLTQVKTLQLVKWYNYLLERSNVVTGDLKLYRVRNGKVYLTEQKESSLREIQERVIKATKALISIENELKNRYKDKELHFYQPEEHIDIKLPTSAKSFVGSYPLYTTIDVPEDYQIGVYWNEEGDIDLHAETQDGKHVGYYSEQVSNIVYTGDMIHLNEQGLAAEAMLVRSEVGVTFSINPYNKLSTEAAKVYISTSNNPEATRVVEDGEMIFQSTIPTEKANVFAIGLDKQVALANFNVGGRVPDEKTAAKLAESIQKKTNATLSLKRFANIIGAKFVEEQSAATHDFSQEKINAGTFIDLLS